MRLKLTPHKLQAITDSAVFAVVFCVTGGFALASAAFETWRTTNGTPVSTIIPVAFGIAFFAVGLFSWERTIVEFDAAARITTWRTVRINRGASGSMPLADILGVGVETRTPSDGARRHRLYLRTKTGDFVFSGVFISKVDKINRELSTLANFLRIPMIGESSTSPFGQQSS